MTILDPAFIAKFNRCPNCGLSPQHHGHRSHIDGEPTGCADRGPLAELLRFEARRNTEANTSDAEWSLFVAAIKADAAAHDGLVSQNRVRDAVGGRWKTTDAKRRYSLLWARARREHLLTETDELERSTDRAGGNSHRRVPVLRWAA